VGLETGTYISDLVQTNPAVSDQESQGANHLQLIKKVLQNTFPVASLAFQFPTTQSISGNTSALVTDQNKIFLANTAGGAITLTLPTLVSANAGWECSLIKTSTDVNPVFVAPPTGTIQSGEIAGLSKCRRCIPGLRTRFIWTGTAWIAERGPRAPVGTILDYSGSTLPVGYEWPNGQTLSSSANYPEINSVWGALVTPDLRGRISVGKDDMGGSAANRVTTAGSGISGVTLGASGGSQNLTIAQANLPNVVLGFHGNSPGVSFAQWNGSTGNFGQSGGGAFLTFIRQADVVQTALPTPSGTIDALGSGTALQAMNPSLIVNKIIVTE
jgi:hypothetical protein